MGFPNMITSLSPPILACSKTNDFDFKKFYYVVPLCVRVIVSNAEMFSTDIGDGFIEYNPGAYVVESCMGPVLGFLFHNPHHDFDSTNSIPKKASEYCTPSLTRC